MVTDEQALRAEEKLQSFGARSGAMRVAVGAGASYGSAKCWPPERFAVAINRLMNERKAEIILFGTLAEAAVSAAIQAGLDQGALDLTGKTEIAELPALLSRCTVFWETIRAPCTLPRQWGCRWLRYSGRPMHVEPLR